MDQNKNQGQRQGEQQSGQQHTQQNPPQTQNPNRPSTPRGTGEPAEGARHQDVNRGNQGTPGSTERSRGSKGERNRGGNRGEGISNRGMDRELEEQTELPERGSSQTDRESER